MRLKKLISFMLMAAMLVLSLAACTTPGGDQTDTTTAETVVETDPVPEKILISDVEKYVIVRSEDAGYDLSARAGDLRTSIVEATGISTMKYKDDFFRENNEALKKGEFEILIGDTNRDESQQFLKDLRYNDYGYAVINNRIVIAGHTDEATIKAIDLFEENVIKSQQEEGVFMVHETRKVESEYKYEDLKLNDISVKDFVIIYPDDAEFSEDNLAITLAETLSNASGYRIKAYEEKEYEYTDSDNVILIGAVKSTRGITVPSDLTGEETYIDVNANTVLLTGGGFVGVYNAVKNLRDASEAPTNEVVSVSQLRQTIVTDYIKAMSFNIYVGKREDARTARVIKMIENYMPDVFGVQEADPKWMTTLRNALPAYNYVGVGRDGGDRGEYSAIFYLKDKFTVVETATKWLSDTPDKVSKVSESSLNRILTYAVFKRNSDGKTFVHINTHFDHTNDTARSKQAAVLVDIAKQFSQYPILLTGDFNCQSGTGPYSTIVGSGFKDSSLIAGEAVTGATYHGYAGKTSIIDFCFVTPGTISVTKYKVCNEAIDGEYASDHHPVYIEFVY